MDEDTVEMKNIKIAFRKFAKWFLQNRSLRYILSGNMADKLQYIKYKNFVLLQFIDKPEKWKNNISQ